MTDLVSDPWLGEQLGKPAWRLRVGEGVAAAEYVRRLQEVPAGASFQEARVSPERTDVLAALESVGFGLVDTNVQLWRRGAPSALPARNAQIRDARSGDRAHVETVARGGFTLSRFHLDPAVPTEVADDLKAAWAGNFFDGARGDRLLVAQDDEGICGFLLALLRDDEVVIDLVAVADRARRRGVGARLVAAVGQGAPSMRVGTQLANMESLRFYQALGFNMVEATHILHRHLS